MNINDLDKRQYPQAELMRVKVGEKAEPFIYGRVKLTREAADDCIAHGGVWTFAIPENLIKEKKVEAGEQFSFEENGK